MYSICKLTLFKMIKKIIILLMIISGVKTSSNDSIILENCSPDLPISVLGMSKTIEYSFLFFGKNLSSVSSDQRKCILSGKTLVSQTIRQCSRDLTINIDTIPFKVAQGLSLNQENRWVSACSPGMPCIIFNQYLANGTVGELMNQCGANQQWDLLRNNKYFWESSIKGFTQCQQYLPSLCIYPEEVENNNKTVMYACPVSKDIFTANFLLLYILSPLMASRLPGCKLRYS